MVWPAQPSRRGNFRDHAPIVKDAHHPIIRHATDLGAGYIPLLENLPNDFFLAAPGNDQHPLLRFTEENFVGRHARLALRHFRQVDLDAGSAAASRFASRARQARGSHVLNSGDGVCGE